MLMLMRRVLRVVVIEQVGIAAGRRGSAGCCGTAIRIGVAAGSGIGASASAGIARRRVWIGNGDAQTANGRGALAK